MHSIIQKKIEEAIANKKAIVFSGSELGYASPADLYEKIEHILRKEAELSGGFDRIVAVAGITPGDGVYEIAARLGIQTIGIISEEARRTISPQCQTVTYVPDPDKTGQLLNDNGESYRVLAAQNKGVFYALGGGKVTFSELTEAQQKGIKTYAWEYAPDSQALAARQQLDLAKGNVVKTYTEVNDWIKETAALQMAIASSALPEHLQAAYKVQISDLLIDTESNKPTFYRGKNYIRIGNDNYLVRFDPHHATWRIYSEDNPVKPSLPVHYQNNQWQLHNDVGMAGGAPTNLPDSLRVIYKVSLPSLSAELSSAAGVKYQGKCYVRIGEDYYWLNRTTEGVLAIFSPINQSARPIPVIHKNGEWQLALRTNNIDNTFANFSEYQHFRQWFHTAIHTLSLLGSRYQTGAEKPAITPAQSQSLIKFILKYFQMQATYSLEDISALERQSSPLVTNFTYSRAASTRLWEMMRRLRGKQLEYAFREIQQKAMQTTGSASGQPPRQLVPLAGAFSIFPVSRPFSYNGKSPEILDTVPLNLNEKDCVYIKSLGIQLFKAPYSAIDHFIAIRGLRMSQNEAAEILSREIARSIEAGQVTGVRNLLIDFFSYKQYDTLANSFRTVELSPNGLLAPISVDPLIETDARALAALHDVYEQCHRFDKHHLPFYVTQNIAVLQNLIGSDVTAFFTEKTPAIVTAEFTDRLQATLDFMMKIKNELGIATPSQVSARMEQFYQIMQSLHHLTRFQLSWNGIHISLEDTIKQLLPDNVRRSAYVMTGPHGLSVIEQVSRALSADAHRKAAFLTGVYFETPELFPYAREASSVTDWGLKNQKLIVIELHPNNAAVSSITAHDALSLLRTIFDGSSSMQRTIIIDITANHVNEAEIQNIIAAARQYIDSGLLNLVLVQSGTKFFQNGMDISSIGTVIVLNNNQRAWSDFNEAMRHTQQFVPAEDKTYFARMLSPENSQPLQNYLDKIRENTRLLRRRLEKTLAPGHNNNNALELSINTDPQTVYIALRPTKHFIALQTKQPDIDSLPRNEIIDVTAILYEKYFLTAFEGLANVERQSFGFNSSSFSQCDEAIRISVGIEDVPLLEDYVKRIVKMGEELYNKGVIADYFKPEDSLGGDTSPTRQAIKWPLPSDLQKFRKKIQDRLKNPDIPQDTAGESRRIILLQQDPITLDAAMELFSKHPENSELILNNPHDTDSTIPSSLKWNSELREFIWKPVSPPAGKLKLLLVGHGINSREREEGAAVFGGRSLKELESNFRKMLAEIKTGGVNHINVTLVGCLLVDINARETGLPRRLADILLAWSREQGINPENLQLTASQLYVRVTGNGKKAYWLPYEGKWVSKEQAIKEGVSYKAVWRYDGTQMVSEVQQDRLAILVERLWNGIPFHEFSPGEQELLLRVLKKEDIDALSTRSHDGQFLRRAIQAMPAEGVTDGHKALATALDPQDSYLAELARKTGINPHDAKANASEGSKILAFMERETKGKYDSELIMGRHTRDALGLRARLLTALQVSGNVVLTLGATAALCRLYAIKKRLEGKTLRPEERDALLVEMNLTAAELAVDLTQEASEFINSKFGLRLAQASVSQPIAARSAPFRLGTKITQGLRAFGLSTTATILAAVGTAFAWYSVITAARELHKLGKSTATGSATEMKSRISQLQVNLGVNIMTALVSTVLTTGTVVSLVAGIATSLGIAGAAAVAAGTGAFMSVAGPIGGAILVAAFVGLWIYNGIKTVEEFSRHIELNGLEKLALGAGSLFGYIPNHLQIKYDVAKLTLAINRTVALEKSGLLDNMPEARKLYHFRPEIVPGRIEPREQYIDTVNGMPTWTPDEVTEAQVYSGALDIDMDKERYTAQSAGGGEIRLSPNEFIHVRQTSEEVVTDKAYAYGGNLTIHGRQVELPNSAFGPDNHKLNGAAISAKLARVIPQKLKDILTRPDARIFAADEAEHLALFCIHDQGRQISFFKYKGTAQGNYQLAYSHTQNLPAAVNLEDTAAILFHDLYSGDGLADLVAVYRDGSLKVLRQRRNGAFVLTEVFSFYRVGDSEKLSFPWYDSILGFGGTTRTLYSHSSGGTRYSHIITSEAEKKSMVSLVSLNRGPGESNGQADKFITSLKEGNGDFFFHLDGGREKQISGGSGNDTFFLLDEKTFCKLKGNGGNDTLNFIRLGKDIITGIVVDTWSKIDGWDGQVFLHLKNGRTEARVFFSGIRNFTGTSGDDELRGNADNNDINGGGGGRDIIRAGDGNDRLGNAGSGSILDGGKGTDHYDLRRLSAGGTTELMEDYRQGEDSHVSLDYCLTEIEGIAPENDRHLLITLTGGIKYRLHDFYNNTATGTDGKKSSWSFTTKDGFRFRLETSAAPPESTTALKGIPVTFQGTLTEEERTEARINLHAARTGAPARVEIIEKVAGRDNVRRHIDIPAVFTLELCHARTQGDIKGSDRSEHLTGTQGNRMKGYGGQDFYFIDDATDGIVEIDNQDIAFEPKKDSLILPWSLSETTLSVDGNNVLLSHSGEPDGHVRARLLGFMAESQFRHLVLQEPFGSPYQLEVTNGKAWLADGPLLMDKESRLELLSASEGGLILDGRSRKLSGDSPLSTVIIDSSGRGNSLAGTENAHNYLQVSGGRNSLYGGHLADTLIGGSGDGCHDWMAGGAGDDIYRVSDNATLDDAGGNDTLVLIGVTGTAMQALQLDKMGNNLYIRFKTSAGGEAMVIIREYFSASDQKIERLIIEDTDWQMDSLVSAMVVIPAFSDSTVVQNNLPFIDSIDGWVPLSQPY